MKNMTMLVQGNLFMSS